MAKTLSITDTQIKALTPKEKVYSKSFGGGLYVFVQPAGKKVVQYASQRDGVKKRYHIGDYGTGKNEKRLNDILDIYREKCGKGSDPLEGQLAETARVSTEKMKAEEVQRELKEKKRREDARLGLDDASEIFLTKFNGLRDRKPSARTMGEFRNHMNNHIVPKWGHQPLDELPVESIMVWLGRYKPVMANRLFATMSAFSTWAVKNKHMIVNPFVGRDKPGGVEE